MVYFDCLDAVRAEGAKRHQAQTENSGKAARSCCAKWRCGVRNMPKFAKLIDHGGH
jgi:hypothetical protein